MEVAAIKGGMGIPLFGYLFRKKHFPAFLETPGFLDIPVDGF